MNIEAPAKYHGTRRRGSSTNECVDRVERAVSSKNECDPSRNIVAMARFDSDEKEHHCRPPGSGLSAQTPLHARVLECRHANFHLIQPPRPTAR